VYKISVSAAKLANCILLHTYSRTAAAPAAQVIFYYNSKTNYEQLRLKIPEKFRTASLNSKFTGF